MSQSKDVTGSTCKVSCFFCSFEAFVTIADPFQCKSNTCNVEIFLEYKDIVKKVLERWLTRAIIVFVDMKDVDCASKKVCPA